MSSVCGHVCVRVRVCVCGGAKKKKTFVPYLRDMRERKQYADTPPMHGTTASAESTVGQGNQKTAMLGEEPPAK